MARPVSFDMGVREWRPALRFGWHSEAANQSQVLGPVAESMSTQQSPDLVARDFDATRLGRPSSRLIRFGPQPGKAIAMARMRGSTIGEIAFGIRGWRRSRRLLARCPSRWRGRIDEVDCGR